MPEVPGVESPGTVSAEGHSRHLFRQAVQGVSGLGEEGGVKIQMKASVIGWSARIRLAWMVLSGGRLDFEAEVDESQITIQQVAA